MAFLCPVRIRRSKKKKPAVVSGYASEGEIEKIRTPGMGRITGSASIETLVRVGLEKEAGLSPDSKMVIVQDFTPCVDDEMEVKRGNVVNVLYEENDWVYVIAEGGLHEGFIPASYCLPLHKGGVLRKKKLPREAVLDPDSSRDTLQEGRLEGRISEPLYDLDNPAMVNSDNDSHGCGSSQSNHTSIPEAQPFPKSPTGQYIVLYTFVARDENDVCVERGDFVTVLNQEDPDWTWVVRTDGQEGFVPSGFVYPADVIQGSADIGSGASFTQVPAPLEGEELGVHGSELVMLYDYKPQATDDLSVRRGEWVYADLAQQTIDGWLWAYSSKANKCGFIPKAYARPPAMTSL